MIIVDTMIILEVYLYMYKYIRMWLNLNDIWQSNKILPIIWVAAIQLYNLWMLFGLWLLNAYQTALAV